MQMCLAVFNYGPPVKEIEIVVVHNIGRIEDFVGAFWDESGISLLTLDW